MFSYQIIRSHLIDNSFVELKNLNQTFQIPSKQYLINHNHIQLDSLVKQISKNISTRITIIDTNGVVLSDSEKDPLKMENHKKREEIKLALKGKIGKSIRYSNTVKKDMIYLALPLYDANNKIIAITRMSYYFEDMSVLIKQIRFEIVEIALFMIIISLFGVHLVSKKITKPLNQLSFAARKVALGDFDIKLKVLGKDEISELTENFNNMTKKLNKLFNKVNSQKERLNTLVSNIQESIVVINSKGEISLYNESFLKHLENEIASKSLIENVITNSTLLKIYKECRDGKSNITKEFSHLDKYYICGANYLEAKEEIVLIIYDISEIKKFELIKKDFVTNVSHELRTPLTAIKGFVETIDDEDDPNEIKHYTDIILRHTNRLINIVNDLLTLSELEGNNYKLEKTNFELKSLVNNLFKIFEVKLKSKNLELIIDIDNNLENIYADPFRIEQVFVNLIENAIKYTDEGCITFSARSNVDNFVFTIQDTGIGIQTKDKHRIFERFYVVDKSRSRKVGGTGLGLSIVKHIINLHNGEIKLDESISKGTKFIITIPKT